MVAVCLFEKPYTVDNRTPLVVLGAEIQASDSGEGDGGSTHGAGLKRDIKIAVGQTFVA